MANDVCFGAGTASSGPKFFENLPFRSRVGLWLAQE